MFTQKLKDIELSRQIILIAMIQINHLEQTRFTLGQLLEECACELSEPLYILFRNSVDTGRDPDQWERPMLQQFTKRVSSSVQNYRPI